MATESSSRGALSRRDRILLHLLPFRALEATETATVGQTQEGIGSALEKALSTVNRPLRSLLDDGLAADATRHVAGVNRRKKVYWLTPKGRDFTEKLRDEIMNREVEVQTLDGQVRVCLLGEVNGILGVNLPLTTLVSMVSAGKLTATTGGGRPEQSRFMPALPDRFVRRRELIGELDAWIGSQTKVLALHGLAGSGKSLLARSFLERHRGSRSLMWYKVTTWDTPETFVRQMAEWLGKMGQPGLSNALRTGGTDRLGMYLEIIVDSLLSQPPALAVIDDIHLLNGPLQRFVLDLIGITGPEQVRWLLLGRRLDTVDELGARSIALGGLTVEESRELLSGTDTEVEAIWRATAGHVMAMQLLETATGQQDWSSVEGFIQSQILGDLGEEEKKVAELAAISLRPVPSNDLVQGRGIRKQHVHRLIESGILLTQEDGRVDLHALVRDPISQDLSPDDSIHLHTSWTRQVKGQDDDEGLLRQIHHAVGAEKEKQAHTILERKGRDLVERGRTELFHLIEPLTRGETETGRDWAHITRARCLLMWGEFDEVDNALAQIEGASRGPKELKMTWLQVRGELARQRGDLLEVKSVKKEVVNLEKRGKESWATGEAHNELGLYGMMEGDHDAARHHFTSALEIFERIEQQGAGKRSGGSVKTLANMANLQIEEHNAVDAANTLQRAIERAKAKKDRAGQARCLCLLGQMVRDNGGIETFETPAEILNQSVDLFRRLGDRWGLCRALIELAIVHSQQMEMYMARELAAEARSLAEKMGTPKLIAEVTQLENELR